ncbi:MAG: HEAT repeat domain-containing protein [Planctomycetes bacterium]|nr:HEAT repeat domain-containing protein [Planctomycetota bacterium]
MVTPSLPPALAAVARQDNVAADEALVDALPHADPTERTAILEILLRRGRTESLAVVVERYPEYDASLQALILRHIDDLYPAIRMAMNASGYSQRASAIEVIARGGCGALAYLLSGVLQARCPQTQDRAAAALEQMAEELLDRLETRPTIETAAANARLAQFLAEPLAQAIWIWELHRQLPALRATLWLCAWTMPAICRKLKQPGTSVATAINNLLEGTSDHRLAGFAFRALVCPAIRSAAAKAISQARDPRFIRAILDNVWLLGDPEIEHNCRWIRSWAWIDKELVPAVRGNDALAHRAVRLLGAGGGGPEQRIELFKSLLRTNCAELKRAVLWQLIEDRSAAAEDLLTMIAGRDDGEPAALAARELRRRHLEFGPRYIDQGSTEGSADEQSVRSLFERLWSKADGSEGSQSPTWQDALRQDRQTFLVCLRSKLAGGTAIDRVRALRLACSLDLMHAVERQVFHLANDPNVTVRSRAVALLTGLSSPTSHRILRAAMNDPDERVQANAIEALDLLDDPNRHEKTKLALQSPDSRVRANAVKSLLRLEVPEAGDALINMLEDSSPAHRLSALWVVDRLSLYAVQHRIRQLAREDSDEQVRQRAAGILHRYGQEPPRQVSVTEAPANPAFTA